MYLLNVLFCSDAIMDSVIVCGALPALLPYTITARGNAGGNRAWFTLFLFLMSSADVVSCYVYDRMLPHCVPIYILSFGALASVNLLA